MKRIISSIIIIIVASYFLDAQVTVSIYGHVTDSVTNAPISNHPVLIQSDSIYNPTNGTVIVYNNIVYTDTSGYYSDQATLPANMQVMFFIQTNDCNMVTHTVNGMSTNSPIVANFSICVGPASSCLAHFIYSTVGSLNTIHFLDNSLGNPISWYWDFGDGLHSILQSPTHTYSQSGTYTVCLVITNANSCIDTACKFVYVGGNTSCSTSFTYSTNNLTANFNASSTGTPPYLYLWTFGDNTTGTGQNPTHSYVNPGNYLVTLTMSDSAACIATYSQNITVTNQGNCIANFLSVPDTANLLNIHFIDVSLGNPSAWGWDFGDNSTSTLQNPSHTYNQAGLYNVCLAIHNNVIGCTDTICDTIHVGAPAPCHSYFTYTANNLALNFTGISSLPAASYTWNFGDGSSSTSQNPIHVYTQPGYYTVCLLTSGNGVVCSPYCQTIHVSGVITTGHIYGHIHLNNSFANHALIYLIEYDSATQLLTAIDTTNIIQAGYYSFPNVPFGAYLVKVALSPLSPYYWNYLPTYHDSVLLWNQANYVVLNSNSVSANIQMIAGNNPGGPGFIGGNVTQGANKLLGAGDPLENVEILLIDENNDPVAYTYSDVNGDYGFNNLAYGTYKVHAEMINKTTYPILVTISATQDSVTNINIVVNSNNIVSGIEDTESELFYSIGSVFPNPVNENAFINLSVKRNVKIEIILYNYLGEQIRQSNEYVSAGINTILLNASQLPEGMYFFSLKSKDGSRFIRKFIKLK
ncbi:PKD domain-containing protein [Bacteroidota bacterium]